MVSLVVTLCAVLVLGLAIHVPVWLRRDVGVRSVAPGMLVVDDVARGVVAFGDGYTVSLYASGLRVARYGDVLLDTVTEGSFVSALTGSETGHHEDVDRVASNLHVTGLALTDGRAVWSAVVHGPENDADDLHRVRIEASRSGTTVRLAVSVTGADGVVLHLDPRAATRGVPPALPRVNLRQRAWWVRTTRTPLFTNVLGVRVGLEAGRAARAVDLRQDNVLDLHAWTSSVVLTATPVPKARVAHS